MSNITWTEDELQEFNNLINMVSSRVQLNRIEGRINMTRFVMVHGKEKCDAMWNFLEQKEKA